MFDMKFKAYGGEEKHAVVVHRLYEYLCRL
jgi:hypothetical protein